ncbi:hypothetical protein FDP41_008294 [Naegleria fowleri]|uniref:Uncharacterized protein n=1 Tax=Naegleria fowleri TaxID=5763 RepID=A0A6A5BHT5_NAEFO|nr:uncharacterized protein FDP41_008294 [Naegleria fowleri]KAF0973590.1 hypothetical protein FDP41_008294 [Naegleria fowleri]CAG4707920.1 unnamed protein product [Naegleria fowleri]
MENLLNHQWFACGFNNYHQIDDYSPRTFHNTASTSQFRQDHFSFRKVCFEPFSHSSHSDSFELNHSLSEDHNTTRNGQQVSSLLSLATQDRQDRIQLFYGEFIETVCGGSFHTVIKTNFHRVFILGAPCSDFSEQDFAILEEEEKEIGYDANLMPSRALFENSKIGDVSNATLLQTTDDTHTDTFERGSTTLSSTATTITSAFDQARDDSELNDPSSSSESSTPNHLLSKKRTFCEISKHPLLRHSTISHIACGREHTILVTLCGNVFSLGSNSHGQCGVKGMKTLRGETSIFSLRVKQLTKVDFSHLFERNHPEDDHPHHLRKNLTHSAVRTNHHLKFSMIGCGQRFTILVQENGLEMIVFGDNTYGQLMLNSNPNSSSNSDTSPSNASIFVPQVVNFRELLNATHHNHHDNAFRTNNDCGEKIVKLAVGGFHTIILTSHHHIYVSGRNYEGQLGLGPSCNNSYVSSLLHFQKLTYFEERHIRIESISCGEKHSVFLASNGNVYACGSNYKGQTGIHYNSVASTECLLKVSHSLSSSPVLPSRLENSSETFSASSLNHYHQYIHEPQLLLFFVEKGMKVKAVSCGAFHTWFHGENGESYSCGSNEEGQLGSGSQVRCQLIPVKFNVNRVQCHKDDNHLKRRMSLMMRSTTSEDHDINSSSSEDDEESTNRMMNRMELEEPISKKKRKDRTRAVAHHDSFSHFQILSSCNSYCSFLNAFTSNPRLVHFFKCLRQHVVTSECNCCMKSTDSAASISHGRFCECALLLDTIHNNKILSLSDINIISVSSSNNKH